MMRYQKQIFLSGLFAILGLASTQTWAQRLFATTIPAMGSTSTLVELHHGTGALVNTIGPVGYNVTGLTYDDTTGTLYAVTWKNDPIFPNGLISINQSTGAGTPIGAGAGLGVGNTPILLTANSSGELYGWVKPADSLIKWDKQTGTAVQIGNSGISTSKHGLAFDDSDFLFLFNGHASDNDGVYLIDPSTGISTFIGTMANGGTANGMAHHGDFGVVSGVYYGLDNKGTGPKNLLVIDAIAIEAGAIIPTINDLHALAFAPDLLLLGECDGTGGFSVKDVVCTIDKTIDADPNSTLGECDNISGLNQQDVLCTVEKTLGPQF